MYFLFSMIAGVLIALMIVVNGELASSFGLYSSTAIIHLVGLVFISIAYIFSKKPEPKSKKPPFYLYIGGMIGVFTIVFNNMAFGKISISAILALGLLGQSITSIIIDQFGLMKMPKVAFNKRKIIGLIFVLTGILMMVSINETKQISAIIVALLAGLTVVTSRTINARLANETSAMKSTLFNYIIGFASSIIILMFVGRGEAMFTDFALPTNPWIYTGGLIGVVTVMVLNLTVSKISSFYLTLLLFVGQVFTGIIIDIVLSGAFSTNNLIGGILVATGLSLNVIFDKMKDKEKLKAADIMS